MTDHNRSLVPHAGPAAFGPAFGFRISDFLRISAFGFRISPCLYAGLAVFALAGLAVAPAASFRVERGPEIKDNVWEPLGNGMFRATVIAHLGSRGLSPNPARPDQYRLEVLHGDGTSMAGEVNQGGVALPCRFAPAPALVDIPAGTFVMGSPAWEPERAAWEGPQTMVTIANGFKIGRFEVTQGEWQAVMTNNPSYYTGDSNLPVEQVTWADATNYCGQLTLRERQSGCLPAGWVYRLPTEAEWEYACRAGSTNAFAYGPALLSGMANFDGHYEYNSSIGTISDPAGVCVGTTVPVGQYAPNAWGLYDMHGNTWEWCLDGWRYNLPGGSVTNPLSSASSPQRVIRGGGLYNEGRECRSAYRLPCGADYVTQEVGFRVVLAPVWLKARAAKTNSEI
jgi:formylglycine-generating enzyme required for sulfatase activity